MMAATVASMTTTVAVPGPLRPWATVSATARPPSLAAVVEGGAVVEVDVEVDVVDVVGAAVVGAAVVGRTVVGGAVVGAGAAEPEPAPAP